MPAVLRRVRESRGYSTRQLAAEIGCTHATISNAETGRHRPRARTCARLSAFLGLPIDVLLMPDTTNAAAPGSDGDQEDPTGTPLETQEIRHEV